MRDVLLYRKGFDYRPYMYGFKYKVFNKFLYFPRKVGKGFMWLRWVKQVKIYTDAPYCNDGWSHVCFYVPKYLRINND